MRVLYCLLLSLFIKSVCSQDIHFSEFYASPININPSLTGLFLGDIRAGLSYRDQYRAVADPFQTMSLAVDWRKTNVLGRKHSLGYGGIVNADVAGDANFGTYQLGVPFAFHFYLSRKLRFSSGFLASFQTQNINEDKLRFGDQFVGYEYDQDVVTSEPLKLNSRLMFNLGVGINLRYYIEDRNLIGIGGSMYNINEPNQSLYNESAIKLYRRYNVNAHWRFAIMKYADAIPMLRYSEQGANQVLQVGTQIFQYIQQSKIRSISYGVWYRALDRDAIIANIGFMYGVFYWSVNYDINTSTLSEASNNRGAFEIHGILYFDKSKKRKKQKIVSCPGHI